MSTSTEPETDAAKLSETTGPEATETADTTGPARAVDGLTPDDRRRLRRAWWTGAAPTLAVYAWIVTVGRLNPFQRNYFDDFYDAQARALFHGHLDVPRDVVQFEGFLIDGRTYIYFGPVPALLRMPVLLVTDRFDGRITAVSMLIATIVLAVAAFRLVCVLRAAVRGDAPLGSREPLATGVLAVACLAAPPLFLASSAVVYHEAAIWGLALAVAGFDAVARWQREPTRRRLVVASALITAAVLSRQSVGFGPLVALAISAALELVLAPEVGVRTPTSGARTRVVRQAAGLGLAVLVPVVAAVGMNEAKFGTLLTPPSDRHIQSLLYPDRREVLAEHGGSLFDVDFAPTTLKQYLRPDGIDVRRDFPWIDFPRLGPSLVGDTRFDELDWTSSIPASAPALTVGALAAGVWAVRTRRRRTGPEAWRLAALAVGTAAGAAGVIAVGYIANRYLADVFPVALVLGVIGFHAWLGAAPRWRARRRRLAAGAVLALVVVGALGNTSLALSYQRERGPVVPEAWRAQWVDWRLSLPGVYEPYLLPRRAGFLPGKAFDGRLAIVGRCDGMYVRVGDKWLGVERGPRVGVHELRVDLDRLPAGERYPLVTLGSGQTMTIVAVRRVDDERVRVDVSDPPAGTTTRGWHAGDPVALSGEVTIRVEADARTSPTMILHGRRALNGTPVDVSNVRPRYGQAPDGYGVATAYPGGVPLVPYEPDVCREAYARGD